ncbi:hypothetical protein [Limnovirga soli]|uniref:Uncharacterized protein n=1 Tax=Limnovirga soli TaxID=2656915 RepID=A0A8J8FFS5_9BACT|nr:hypothetical protein [Limnovirga soli]NNV57311.1 hypothetical protein [Limnovirga soli]
MENKRLIQAIPTLILSGILINTWIIILRTDYFATIKHQIGLSLFLLIVALYFYKFKYGIILTGFFLSLATFNAIAIFPDIISSSYFIKIGNTEISTPSIEWKSFLLLFLFFVCSGGYLISLYSEYKNKINK